MTTTITGASGNHTPQILDGWKGSRESRHVVHPLLASGTTAVTLRPAAPEQGTLKAIFSTLAQAKALRADLAAAATLTISDTDRAEIGMTFIAISSSEAELEDVTRELGVVTFTYLKV